MSDPHDIPHDSATAATQTQTRTQALPPGFPPVNPRQVTPPMEPPTSLLKGLRNSLLAGLFIMIPAVISLLVALYIYDKLTAWAVDLVRLLPWTYDMPLDGFWFTHSIRVFSLLVMLAALILIGQVAKLTLGKKLISLAQAVLLKVPLINFVYSTVQQIGDALWSSKGGMFRQAVIFEFPMEGVWSVGFLTNEYEKSFEVSQMVGEDELISVFMPTTPNPTSGFLMLIPKRRCKPLKMEVSEAMRFIISGGAISPALAQTLSDSKAKGR